MKRTARLAADLAFLALVIAAEWAVAVFVRAIIVHSLALIPLAERRLGWQAFRRSSVARGWGRA